MKTICIIIFLFILSIGAISQVRHSYGVFGSYNSTSLVFEKNIDKAKGKSGFGLGGFIKLPIISIISVRVETHLIQKRFQYTTGIFNPKLNIDYAITYFMVPLSVQAEIETPIVTPFAEIGFFLSQKISSLPKSVNFYSSSNQSFIPVPVETKSSEHGILLGLGCEIPIKNFNTIVVGYRYSPGLSKVGDFSLLDSWKLKTSLVYLGVII